MALRHFIRLIILFVVNTDLRSYFFYSIFVGGVFASFRDVIGGRERHWWSRRHAWSNPSVGVQVPTGHRSSFAPGELRTQDS